MRANQQISNKNVFVKAYEIISCIPFDSKNLETTLKNATKINHYITTWTSMSYRHDLHLLHLKDTYDLDNIIVLLANEKVA